MDFALLAAQMGADEAVDPNEASRFDLNADRQIDVADVAAFSEFWLERTDVGEPNEPVPEL